MTAPRISVVVPTRDRAASLERLLTALEAQTLPPERFEVIVVDDGSVDGTGEVLRAASAQTPFRLAVIRVPCSHGPAHARNLGWNEATAPFVAFTDDDCRPAPGWLEAGLRAVESVGGVVMGRTVPDPAGPGLGEHFSRTMHVEKEDGRYPTCNVFYPRDALVRVRGFDEGFEWACGEDTDLAWRVKKSGSPSAYCADAVVVHDVRPPSFRKFLAERRRFAEQIRLVARHPEIRPQFYRWWFYRRSHVHAIALVGLGAAAMLVAGELALLAPLVLLDRWRTARPPKGARGLVVRVQLVLADLWEVAVFCYGSVRYRTLLL